MKCYIGDVTSTNSTFALNRVPLGWFKANNDRNNRLPTARALILGGGALVVPIHLEKIMPVMSYLRLIIPGISVVLLP